MTISSHPTPEELRIYKLAQAVAMGDATPEEIALYRADQAARQRAHDIVHNGALVAPIEQERFERLFRVEDEGEVSGVERAKLVHPSGASLRKSNVEDQIEQLARCIMDHVPGEPSQSEGAVACAIRLLRTWAPMAQDSQPEPEHDADWMLCEPISCEPVEGVLEAFDEQQFIAQELTDVDRASHKLAQVIRTGRLADIVEELSIWTDACNALVDSYLP